MTLKRNTKKLLWLAAFAAVLIALAYAVRPLLIKQKPPEEFMAARKEAATVSQKIVDLTSATNEKIKATYDISYGSGDPDKALAFIQEALQTNSEAYDQAFKLSSQL